VPRVVEVVDDPARLSHEQKGGAITMDGPPAIALGFDAPRPDLMNDPPQIPPSRCVRLTGSDASR
jgi:hypothetical protein